MYRKFIEKLKAWDAMANRKPLLVTGARQVGKTWIIKEFCKNTYGEYIYLNLERQEDVCSVFDT